MNIYLLQKVYRSLRSRPIRLAALKAVKAFKFRTLLVRMDLSNYCNIRCVMCQLSSETISRESRKIMQLEDFKEIANDIFRQTRSLHLSCSYEPLVVDHFGRCLIMSKEFGIPFISFATNGMLLSEHICDIMIKSAIDEVIVSVDGATKSTFESIRRGANFSRLINNLERLKRMKAGQNKAKPVLRLNYTLMDRNIREIPEFIDKFSSLGMKILELRPLKYVVKGLDVRNDFTRKGIELYNKLFSEIRKACHKKNIRLIAFPGIDNSDKEVYKKGDGSSGIRRRINPCILPLNTFSINAAGNLKPCTCDFSIGNMLNKSYKDMMKSEAMRKFTNTVAILPNSYCDECPLKEDLIA